MVLRVCFGWSWLHCVVVCVLCCVWCVLCCVLCVVCGVWCGVWCVVWCVVCGVCCVLCCECAEEEDSVDLGGRGIIKKKKQREGSGRVWSRRAVSSDV